MPEFSYSIATGWDNEAGFTNVEALTPAAGTVIPGLTIYFVVKAYNTYRRGQRRFDIATANSYVGFKSVGWRFLDVSAAAYNWLFDTYNGQLTIRTTTGVDGVYSNWNVYPQFPDPADLTESDTGRFGDVDVPMILVETT